MCEFKPNTTLNAAALARYDAVRVRVMRQVYYSAKSTNSIDLVLFVNGLPAATLELKTDNVQSIDAAIAQYKHHRDPRGEPLLGFANRCLVHFAVSNDRVAMTTRLQQLGGKTEAELVVQQRVFKVVQGFPSLRLSPRRDTPRPKESRSQAVRDCAGDWRARRRHT